MSEKLLKVTNRATGKTWMKSEADIAHLKSNPATKDKYNFESAADVPVMASKLKDAKPVAKETDKAPETQS